MAAVVVNGKKCVQKILNGKKINIELAAGYIEQEVKDLYAEEAAEVQAYSLCNTDIYDSDITINTNLGGKTEANVIGVIITPTNDGLIKPVGSEREYPYNHTSPLGEEHDPEVYYNIVNSGHSGDLWLPSPYWDGRGGMYMRVLNQLPKTVGKCLRKAGLIFKY